MSITKNLWLKAYYTISPLLVKQHTAILPSEMSEKINMFIYFDYEREFCGHPVSICDDDIKYILSVLSHANFRTTWFTVGKVLKMYPESVKAIHDEGHEIGSHTFSHISPLSVSKAKLVKDFDLFSVNKAGMTIEGFHSPMGQWSISLLSLLTENGYIYDVISGGCFTNKPIIVTTGDKQNLYRLITIGDDWHLYAAGPGGPDPFNYFKNKIEELNPGDLAGFGFHPWILAYRPDIMNGFRLLIEYLEGKKYFLIEPAINFINKLKNYHQ